MIVYFTQDLTLLGPVLVEPFKVKTPSWRLIRARLVLLERLMEDPGYNSSGLTVRTVMEVGCTSKMFPFLYFGWF